MSAVQVTRGMDGISRLRESGGSVIVSLREIAEDLADYVAMRPELAHSIDALANYIAGLHPLPAPPARPSMFRNLLPGEADDVADGGDPDRWIGVYQHLIDAADVTGVGVDVQVHLMSRLAFWRSRQVDLDIAGHPAEAVSPK